MIESLDPDELSRSARFERELEIHNVRQSTFETEQIRIWERRSTALDLLGDGLFLLFARDHAPLPERLTAIAGRLESVPTFLDQARSRARVPQVRPWQKLEIQSAAEMPAFFDEILAMGDRVLGDRERRRLERAVEGAKIAVAEYRGWLLDSIAGGTDDWAIGRELQDEFIAHRAFDGLDSDAILELGLKTLAEEKAAPAATAREIDPDVDEPAVVDLVPSSSSKRPWRPHAPKTICSRASPSLRRSQSPTTRGQNATRLTERHVRWAPGPSDGRRSGDPRSPQEERHSASLRTRAAPR